MESDHLIPKNNKSSNHLNERATDRGLDDQDSDQDSSPLPTVDLNRSISAPAAAPLNGSPSGLTVGSGSAEVKNKNQTQVDNQKKNNSVSTPNTNNRSDIDMESSPDDDDDQDLETHPRRKSNEDNHNHVMANESDGTVSDGGTKNPLRSKYSKKIRRNATASRSLSKFKRIKQHKLKKLKKNNDELYDVTDDFETAEDDNLISLKPMYRLSAFCTCDSYNLSDVIEQLEHSDIFGRKLTLYADVLQIKQKAVKRDAFIFTYGCVVFFNWPEKAEQHFLSSLRPFAKQPLHEYEVEDFDFCYGEQSSVSNDEIRFQSRSSLEKLSVSFALAQCVKLSIYEERIAREIESNKRLPLMLAQTGSIGMSRLDISKKIGTLFIERNNVNLHFDVLDTPEFFWEQDKFKHVYDRLFNYLELGKRVDLLNKRLDLMKELLDMLNDQLENIHSHKLEWIIIWLIVFEVIVIVFWNILLKDIFGFFPRSETE